MQSHQLSTSIAFFRDKFVPFSEANVSIASSGFLYGLTIYTVFTATWNEEHQQLYIFRLDEHYNRLVNSARIMDFADFKARYSFEQFKETMLELLKRNKAKEDVLVRVMIFVDELAAGTKIRGLRNELAVFVYPMGEILPTSGAHVCVSSWVRTADNMMPARAKVNGTYVNASLMKNEALVNGYDDAIAIDSYGHVAEGTVANLFLVRSGTLITPDASTDILEGITRSSILTMATDLSIPVIERSVDRSELYAADEAMFTGSSASIVPILSIDRRPIGDAKPGPLTTRITDHFSQLRRGLLEKNWLTSVYPKE